MTFKKLLQGTTVAVTTVLAVIANASAQSDVVYQTETVDGVEIFYRQSGNPEAQPIVLLHGFPSSSHQYRDVVSQLGDEFYVIAPDYPGFGFSEKPSIEDYKYTFDNLAETMGQFLDQKGVDDYFLMIHDYGAPVGFRIALDSPDDVAGFIIMNGNAYEEGLGEVTKQSLAKERSPEDEQAKINGFMSLEGIQWQYVTGTSDPSTMSPDSWTLDHALINSPEVQALNLELLYDYPNNTSQYPLWQDYLRQTQPPMLIVWGKNDQIFPESGAEAYKQDVKVIDYNIYDTGHFPLEEFGTEITAKIRTFVSENVSGHQ